MLYTSACTGAFEDCWYTYNRIAVQLVRNVHFTYCTHKMHALPHGHVDFNRPTSMPYTNAGCLEFFCFRLCASGEVVEHVYMNCQV